MWQVTAAKEQESLFWRSESTRLNVWQECILRGQETEISESGAWPMANIIELRLFTWPTVLWKETSTLREWTFTLAETAISRVRSPPERS